MPNLESASSLSRWKRQFGATKAGPYVETVPSYISRCSYKREIMNQKSDIMNRMRLEHPEKHNRMRRDGFDPMVMTVSDEKFLRFVEWETEMGVVEAYFKLIAAW